MKVYRPGISPSEDEGEGEDHDEWFSSLAKAKERRAALIAAALSDLLADQPNVDLGALTSEEIAWVVERHLVYEIHYRVQLDVGKSVIDNAPSPATAMRRLDEIRDYIQETVASAFRERRSNGMPLTNAEATKLANSVLEDTFAARHSAPQNSGGAAAPRTYLAAAKARQARRDALQPADIAHVAELIDTVNTAQAALRTELGTWTDDGEKWPDRHAIRGLIEP